MGNKINLQQLAKTLAQKKNLSQRDAEAFLKEFFDSIIQNVTTDKLVKIKGLGTFKLIEVLDRESINVNTGERFIIPGHSKLSFTPETALKDLINKPFADFQTVVINEGTSIEEMERLPQEEAEAEPSPEEEAMEVPETEPSPVQAFTPVPEPATVQEAEPESAPEPAATQEAEPESAPEPAATQEAEPKPVPEPSATQEAEPEPVPEPAAPQEAKTEPVPEQKSEPVPEQKIEPADTKPSKPFWKVFATIAGVLVLCLLCFFAGRYMTRDAATPQPSPVENEDVTAKNPPAAAPVEEVEKATQYAQVPDGEYRIIGTRKTHIMKPGDYLSKIAIAEYGDKDFTKYIIVHNDFPDPDNVPVDMEIKLPELEKIE